MNSKNLAERFRSGGRIYGTLITSPSPHYPELIKGLGFDYVFIDTEHIPLQREQLAWMCRTYKALGLPPIVRIPSHSPYEATVVLDGGACGVVAPYIETPEQVLALVGATKKRPLKGELLEQHLAGKKKLGDKLETYVSGHTAGNLLIVNIESIPAIEALDEILAVDGLDAVLIGPHDLTCSLGIPEEFGNQLFIETVDSIIEKARAAGKGAGIHTVFQKDRIKLEARWIERGANLILHSADVIAAVETLRSEIAQVKQLVGDASSSKASNINI